MFAEQFRMNGYASLVNKEWFLENNWLVVEVCWSTTYLQSGSVKQNISNVVNVGQLYSANHVMIVQAYIVAVVAQCLKLWATDCKVCLALGPPNVLLLGP